jgi:hypothetical protein
MGQIQPPNPLRDEVGALVGCQCVVIRTRPDLDGWSLDGLQYGTIRAQELENTVDFTGRIGRHEAREQTERKGSSELLINCLASRMKPVIRLWPMKRKPAKQRVTAIRFRDRAQMKAAYKRAQKLFGNYGFNQYALSLIDADLKTASTAIAP